MYGEREYLRRLEVLGLEPSISRARQPAAECSHAVDATIHLLYTAFDRLWRYKMFADAAMGDSRGAAAVPATSFRKRFPNRATSEKFDWAAVVVELARALVGMQTDSARF